MEIKGIIPAMVTPFTTDERLNLKALRSLTRYLLDGGVHGLFPTGSQGEYYALTPDERQQVWEIVVEETAGRAPVYAGTGAMTTREVVDLNRRAAQVGVSIVSVITPSFITPSQEELYRHYMTIADAAAIPVILYGNPDRTGIRLTPDLVARLAHHPNIVGVKDSSGDFSLTLQYIERTPDDFAVLMGRDTLIYAALLHGGRGSITATANVAPALVVEIYEAYCAGDLERALAAQQKLAPLRNAFGLGTFPVVVKQALNLLGIAAGPARAPVGPMSAANEAILVEVLKNLGLSPKT